MMWGTRNVAMQDGMVTPRLQCRCVACGGRLQPGCLAAPPCNQRLIYSSDLSVCIDCGGLNQAVCCNTQFCGAEGDFSNTSCNDGLTRSLVQVESYLVANQGEGAICVNQTATDVRTACGEQGQRPCLVSEAAVQCNGRSTPSADGLQCVECGDQDELPCVGKPQPCTGQLQILNDVNDEPELCVNSTTYAAAIAARNSGVLDQSGGRDCGLAGEPFCTNGGPACNGRTALVGTMCQQCGGIDDPICSTGRPCDQELKRENSMCVACGTRGERACEDPDIPACDKGLDNVSGRCLAPADTDEEVINQSFTGSDPCGLEGLVPCPGVPGCANGLFLVADGSDAPDGLVCSREPPSAHVPYKLGQNASSRAHGTIEAHFHTGNIRR